MFEGEDSGDTGSQPRETSGWARTAEIEGVTAADIKLFRSSITARRFPGLKSLSDGDVAAMIVADRKAKGRKMEAPTRTFPNTAFVGGDKKSRHDPVWSPSSQAEAKAGIVMPPKQAFVGMYSPYDADRQDFLEKKRTDTQKNVGSAPFVPNSWSEAKQTTQVDYFLYSATAAAKTAERTHRLTTRT